MAEERWVIIITVAMAKAVTVSIWLLALMVQVDATTTLTIRNNCPYTVWPGILTGAGQSASTISDNDVALNTGKSTDVTVEAGWSGRLWGRTGCNFNPNATSTSSCATGDCGGALICSLGAQPPVTLAEFTILGSHDEDYYDVSLVDGFNLALEVVPSNSSCGVAACDVDINRSCPAELQVVVDDANYSTYGWGSSSSASVVACKSACVAFQTDQYCCSGAHATPDTCNATSYSRSFKEACPTAYSYAYDDPTSIFMCYRPDYYTVTFCPSSAGPRASRNMVILFGVLIWWLRTLKV